MFQFRLSFDCWDNYDVLKLYIIYVVLSIFKNLEKKTSKASKQRINKYWDTFVEHSKIIKWKLLNVNINMCHDYTQCKIYVLVSTDTTADDVSWSTLSVFILTLEKSEQKVWMHIKLCLGSAKSKALQEAQKLHCVDAAASDAKILCKWCLASLVDIYWDFFWNDFTRRVQYASHFLLSYWTIE